MGKYIDAEKLIAEIEDKLSYYRQLNQTRQVYDYVIYPLEELLEYVTSFKQEQLKDKQIVIITESHGDANIEWDCRSLDDVKALLESAQSFIADKQVEELRGMGSGSDYNTTEGRFRNAWKFQRKQPKVDIEKELCEYFEGWRTNYYSETEELLKNNDCTVDIDDVKEIARHFYKLGLNARKK